MNPVSKENSVTCYLIASDIGHLCNTPLTANTATFNTASNILAEIQKVLPSARLMEWIIFYSSHDQEAKNDFIQKFKEPIDAIDVKFHADRAIQVYERIAGDLENFDRKYEHLKKFRH